MWTEQRDAGGFEIAITEVARLLFSLRWRYLCREGEEESDEERGRWDERWIRQLDG